LYRYFSCLASLNITGLSPPLLRTGSASASGSSPLSNVPVLTLNIYALDQDTIRLVGDDLGRDIKQITSCARAEIRSQIEIKNLKERNLEEAQGKDLQHIKKTKGVPAYLNALSEQTFRCPDYWSGEQASAHQQPGTTIELPKFCVPLHAKSRIWKAVVDLVNVTWEQDKVGFGNDAKNLASLNYTKICVQGVWRVENPDLLRKYRQKFQTMCRKASIMPFLPVKELKGQQEIKTRQLGKYLLVKNKF